MEAKMNIGIITGTGVYDNPLTSNSEEMWVDTKFGETAMTVSGYGNHTVYHLCRHSTGHKKLPNMINHKANIAALKKCGADFIISTSVMGIISRDIKLGQLLLFNDLFYPDNRLPSGDVCTFFDDESADRKGHYIFDSPFSGLGNKLASDAAEKCELECHRDLTYAYSGGPRFNSKSEIKYFKDNGCASVSQTAGPEAVLCGENEIGYALIGFGVDYANGVIEVPTPVETLNMNLKSAKKTFLKLIPVILDSISDDMIFYDNGFIYWFE